MIPPPAMPPSRQVFCSSRAPTLEPTVPGTTTYEQLGWTATGGLVNQPVATGAIGGQQSGFRLRGQEGLINTFIERK